MARVNRARRLTYLKDRQLIEFNRASKVEGLVSRLVPSNLTGEGSVMTLTRQTAH
jgi:hypothetical protein